MSDRSRMAEALMQRPAMWEPGLEQPSEMKLLQALDALGAGLGAGQFGGGIASALYRGAVPGLRGLGEAGAIFPEGALPKGLSKADMYTDAERQYKLWENTENQYLQNNDFQNALKAKWGMLKNWGGS